jgi:cell division protein FtsW (lipid II flippase)
MRAAVHRHGSAHDRCSLRVRGQCHGWLLERKTGMAVGITPLEGGNTLGRTVAWRWLIEAVLVAVVIAALLPLFAPIASPDTGRDGRYVKAAASTSVVPGADTRASTVIAAKNDAMRTLLETAPWQWASWAGLALLLLNLQRSGVNPAAGIGLGLAAWAAMAWIGRVPWPLAGAHAWVVARPAIEFTGPPAAFVVAMLAAAVVLLLASPWLRRSFPGSASAPASVLTYPGLVAATGIGWLLLLDLSANGTPSNRYLALYHQGHLWLGMLAFTSIAFLRQPIARALAWMLAVSSGLAHRVERRIGAFGLNVLLLPLALLGAAAMAMLLANTRQLTSELGRMWLILGAAWFFFMRGTPLTERLARERHSLASLARYTWPLVFVVLVLVAAMIMTRDMGPLLIAGYGAGAFLAASVAMWLYQRRRASALAYALAMLLFAGWIALVTFALFKVGSVDPVAAERLENAGAPFASVSDQMALVTWFRQATPAFGFGPGAVPWCGFRTSAACAGVPAQIQSDYTFTALVGTFGWAAAWAITLGCAAWLCAAVRPHGNATRGEPRLVRAGGRVRNDEQAFLSWLCVAWVALALCQLAVTVAGNLAVIPLTGVTFPFVSFGMTSLVIDMAMLALAIDVRIADAAR